MNLIFTASYFETTIRQHPLVLDSFSLVIHKFLYEEHHQAITKTFQQLLSKADEALIISKAAIHCLEYLCDLSRTRKEAKRHLQIRQTDRNCRKTRPWKWHQRASCRDFARTLVLTVKPYLHPNDYRLTLTAYRRLYASNAFQNPAVYSLHSLQWIHWRSNKYIDHTPQVSFEYLNLLQYLVTILPRAGRFPPLIHLCKTKAFTPMSMMFPDQSRKARRAIGNYLNRMDTSIDDD